MRVILASAAYDPAGDGWRTKRAFDRYSPTVEIRQTVRRATRFGYPIDLPWARAAREWRRADVVHLQLGFEAEAMLGGPRRPTVIHHHGTAFRRNHRELVRQQRARRALGLASTIDLVLLAPDDLAWSPTPYDLDWLASLRMPVDDSVLRIAHAPTNRESKSTAAFLAACERLGRELRLEVVLVEGVTWAECLRRKASADIYFDQVLTGYGCNAIEAWGMGIPVVAGVDAAEATRRGHLMPAGTLGEMDRRFGGLPFVLADEGTIYEALRSLADPATRAAWAERGRSHVRTFHDERLAVGWLTAVYRAAINGRTVAA